MQHAEKHLRGKARGRRQMQSRSVERDAQRVTSDEPDCRPERASQSRVEHEQRHDPGTGVPMASIVPISRVRSNIAMSSVFTVAIRTIKNTITPRNRKMPSKSVRTCL